MSAGIRGWAKPAFVVVVMIVVVVVVVAVSVLVLTDPGAASMDGLVLRAPLPPDAGSSPDRACGCGSAGGRVGAASASSW